jgi:hypothetical protein
MGGGRVAVGIDFGTTHTVAAVALPDGRVQPVLFDANPLLSSAVYAADDRMLVGRDAERSARLDPARFEPNPKRRIDDGTILLGDREHPVPEVIAAVLGRAWQEATRVLGAPTASVMLTYPANWGGQRRALLADAAAKAGIGPVVLIPEPVAAAVYFTTVLGREVPVGSGIVVYDFGGGTFDTSVVRRQPDGGWMVAAAQGLDNVGGLDLDAALVDRIGAMLSPTDPSRWQRLVNPTDPADRRSQQALWDDVRAAKEQLSRASSAAVHVPLFESDTHVTREEFEALARPWLDRTVYLTGQVISQTGLRPDQIAGLFLVGGSSRIPLAGTLLHRRFGVAPTLIAQPELVVAMGSVWAGLSASAAGTPAAPAAPAAPVSAAPVSPVSPVSPVPAAPVSAAPVSGLPVSTEPVAAAPMSGLPTGPMRPPPPAAAFPAPAGFPPPNPYASVPVAPRRSGLRFTLAIVAAGVVALLLAGFGVTKAWTLLSNADQSSRNGQPAIEGAGAPGGGGTTPAGATGAAGKGAGSVPINKTVWYAGLKLTFDTATYHGGDQPQVAVDATIENLGTSEAGGYEASTTLGVGGKFYNGRLDGVSALPGLAPTNGRYLFDVNGPVDLAKATITVGEADKAQAVVPFAAGGKVVSLEPRPVLRDANVSEKTLTMTVSVCELRFDLVSDHREVDRDSASVACTIDMKYTGDSSGGHLVADANFRLKLPDGSVVAPEKYPIEDLSPDGVKRGETLRFTIRWPGAGRYSLQLLDLGPNSYDAPGPGNTAAIDLQL